jgi:hypothetical protein
MVHGRALLVALTPEARDALGASEREMTSFPYRVGRDSRGTQRTPQGVVSERRNPGSRPSNDLYLLEHDEPMNVSREHFEIDRSDTGYVLVDRASTCGTIVEGQIAGGRHPGRHSLSSRRGRDHRRHFAQPVRLQVPGRVNAAASRPETLEVTAMASQIVNELRTSMPSRTSLKESAF